MEAAAKTVELLTQRHLPEKPHQLSYSQDWRYRPPTTEEPRRIEEWYSSRLQYMTFLSDADRGVLLTRSYYDMREESQKGTPHEATASSKSAGEKKKLSLSDYKNKKTTNASASPPEPAIAKSKEADRLSGTRHVSESKNPNDARLKYRESEPENRRHTTHVVDMSLPPKPPTKHGLPPRPPSPNGKRRYNEYDDDNRPQKRNRPEATRHPDDRRPQAHDDRRREQGRRDTNSYDSTLPNGRTSSRGPSGLSQSRSPSSHSRGEATNGTRQAQSGSSRGTPTKLSTQPKSSVPPLLSPLRLGFEEQSSTRTEKRRRDPSPGRSPPRHRERQPEPKKPKTKLPPLLSPTLPPIVEAALGRKKSDSSESEDRYREEKRSPPRYQKPSGDQSDDDIPLKKRRLIVKLRIPKSLRQAAKRLLALPPGRERSDDEEMATHPRKRPTGDDSRSDSVGMKKTASSRSLAPTTPPRKGTTSMSRVNSNTSIAHTPGDSFQATPTSGSVSMDRRANGSTSQDPSKAAKSMLDKEGRLGQLGRRLKHEADVALGSKARSPSSASSAGGPSSIKLGYVVALESLLAFMLSFQAKNLYRGMCNKKHDPGSWLSMLPLLSFFQDNIMRRPAADSLSRQGIAPLQALILLLHALSVEEIVKCFANVGPDAVSLQELLKHERSRSRLWTQLREANATIESDRLRADIHPWTTLDEVADSVIKILRRWCADEEVNWVPEIGPRDYGRG